jgi:hypothetical protein
MWGVVEAESRRGVQTEHVEGVVKSIKGLWPALGHQEEGDL